MKDYNYFSIKMNGNKNNVDMSKCLNFKNVVVWLIISSVVWFVLFYLSNIRLNNNVNVEEYTKPLMNYKQKDKNDASIVELIILNE